MTIWGADLVQGQGNEALPGNLRCPSVVQYCVLLLQQTNDLQTSCIQQLLYVLIYVNVIIYSWPRRHSQITNTLLIVLFSGNNLPFVAEQEQTAEVRQ